MSTVDIVKVNNGEEWEPKTHYAVEEEKTGNILFESNTQKEAIDWAQAKGHTVKIHRVRNRESKDKHGQYRPK
ncbi:hypothetical protein HVV99_23985 (plasmid) [Escherichia coli]|nr:hypothetical protein [Escherichia coli]QMP57326.1 hypothetical protein HVW01_23985 [Escherichia coli]QMP61999.1 hypothetical protein HVW00_23985 [Escherichia coli]QMP66682.1 hypothetical protein HVV99_23985 [Escherichia coli]QMP71354.1 hypothetical protein HVV98_23985 [Escherichia coli]